MRRSIGSAFIFAFLFQVCSAQQASLGEVAKKLREDRGKAVVDSTAAGAQNAGTTLPEKAAQAKKAQDPQQPKATRVYTNDDFKSAKSTNQNVYPQTQPQTLQQEEASRMSYHQQALAYWCNIDRLQSSIDAQSVKMTGMREAVSDPFVQHEINQLDSGSKQQLNDALSHAMERETNKAIEAQTAAANQQRSNNQLEYLQKQCSQDVKCRPAWLEVSREEREKSGCYQRKP